MNNDITPTYKIPACWEVCDALMLAWPDQDCDDELLEFYEALANILPDYTDLLILVAPNHESIVRDHLESLSISTEYIFFHPLNARDINLAKWGSVIVQNEKSFSVLHADKTCPSLLQASGELFPHANTQLIDFLLPQNLIESDGVDQLILNKSLWLAKNPETDINEVTQFLRNTCGIKDLISLNQPGTVQYLPARLGPDNSILVTACDDPNSLHFVSFQKMHQELERELQALETDYQLRYLPWIGNLTDEQGQEFFADYSQFLVINGAILMPIFNLPSDEDAMELVSNIFPGFDILGFPSAALAKMGCGLSSIALSLPEGVLEPLHE